MPRTSRACEGVCGSADVEDRGVEERRDIKLMRKKAHSMA